MREERDKLAKEAAQLAATRAELETKKAETLAANSALKEAELESESNVGWGHVCTCMKSNNANRK